VNLIVVLRSFEESGARKLMTAFGAAQAAIHLNAMFLLEAEIPAALEAFAMKFADIGRRRHVLHGRDVFENLTVSRKEELFRLKQVLLNLTLRLREIFVARGRHEDRMALTVAEMAGPLRVAAATLLELEGHSPLPPPLAPKEALEKIAGRPLPALSQARETRLLPAGTASATLLLMIELANRMRERATKL
ncbi:MAG: hypothetical protein HY074_00890, partial [Deltaproteobacteria bacterium]|nr:hypothetical protein [Deltaproteobacteria bacterium]